MQLFSTRDIHSIFQKLASVGGNTSLATALLAFLINLDSGPRWVWRNRIAATHTFRAVALQ
jgi:hypothetical protein